MFITKHGNPLDRSNIWRMMKRLCASAGVAAQKVFPHNLRHLFALTFYRKEKDIVRLADLLGHSSIETARIYTQASAESCSRALARLNLTLHRFPAQKTAQHNRHYVVKLAKESEGNDGETWRNPGWGRQRLPLRPGLLA